jgi:CDP-diacylglycerol--serine O-phosphatidyltransferase
MMALKFSPGAKQQNLPRIILLLSSILALLFLQWLAVPVIFIAYILLSLLFKKRIS